MLANKIKELRKSKKMTQKELAAVLSVSQQTIGSWEVGRAEPNSEMINRMASFFDVSADYLLGNDSLPKRNLGSKGALVATHIDDDTSDEDIEDILNYIEMRRKNPLGKK